MILITDTGTPEKIHVTYKDYKAQVGETAKASIHVEEVTRFIALCGLGVTRRMYDLKTRMLTYEVENWPICSHHFTVT